MESRIVTAPPAPDPVRADVLPAWSSVLAVVAHPDDESFGLGAILDAFVRADSEVSVLCLTHGEASTIHGVTGDLATLRETELREAAAALGVDTAHIERVKAEQPAHVVVAHILEVPPRGRVAIDGLLPLRNMPRGKGTAEDLFHGLT